ncbi:MAG TPA: tRNA pseudouridine(55) synthase TruB [Planctomycetota bacterium]|nr:tRNA pseudouridine(55) synthase TruB [Planctomycetota bacterium]
MNDLPPAGAPIDPPGITVVPSGFMLLDKPPGLTSHGVVYAVRKALGLKRGGGDSRVGHLGTLDPNATGLLVMVLGGAGRALEFFSPQDKRYDVTVEFGLTSDTDDIWGVPAPRPLPAFPSREAVEAVLKSEFLGERDQLPPAISAVQVDGKRAHRAARAGKPLTMKPRRVTLRSCTVTRYAPPEIDLALETSSGYYVRSLARDLGAHFGGGAVVKALRRTAVGPWKIDAARPLTAIAADGIIPFFDVLMARTPADLAGAPHGPQVIRAVNAELGERIAKGLAVEMGCERPQGSVWAVHKGTVLAFLLPFGETHWKPKKVFLSVEEYRAKVSMKSDVAL